MIHIALCDDEKAELSKLSQYIEEYSAASGQGVSCTCFDSAVDFIDAHMKAPFDAAFLDVMMPALNGIQTARELRAADRGIKIVFVTSSMDFAVDSYDVDAFYYMLKPVDKRKLFSVLERVIAALGRRKSLMLKTGEGIVRFELDRLCCCEASRKEVLYTLANGTVLKSSGLFFEAAAAMTEYPNFVQPHRSYVINLDYVERISMKEILLKNGVRIPISRAKYQLVKEKYMEYYLNGGRTL